MLLEGRTALVTGAAGGIGRAVVARLEREGATVLAADLVSPATPLDVTAEEQVRAVTEQLETLDILVNAAGIELEKTIEETSLAEWNQSFAVNVTGTFLVSKYALPALRRAVAAGTGASVINFGSYDGFIADPRLAAYCATKGAVHALTRAMAVDHGPEGIRWGYLPAR